MRTFLERDIPQLGVQIPAATLSRFWRMLAHDHGQLWNGAELDLLVVRGRRRLGIEIKRTTPPGTTRSMHSALESLRLDHLDVIHAREHTFPLTDRIRAVAFARMREDIQPLA